MFYVDEVRKWLKRYDDEEISFSKFVELFNERVFYRWQSLQPTTANEQENEHLAIKYGKWMREQINAQYTQDKLSSEYTDIIAKYQIELARQINEYLQWH